MTIPEIIAALTHTAKPFPRQAVEEAVKQREAITPELLRILEYCTANIKTISRQEDYLAHIYAFYLLSQFREPRAYRPFVDFVSSDQESVRLALGDVLTEDLQRMLASVCGGDTSLIRRIIENPDLDEFLRAAGLGAYIVLVSEGLVEREEAIGYFRSLFQGGLKREECFVWGALVSCCCDLHPGELMAEIEQAFEDDLVELSFIGMSYVREKLEKTRDEVMVKTRQDINHTLISDTIREMSFWPCFKDEPKTKPEKEPPTLPPGWPVAPVRTAPKVGRNEPCPCGSGKKYKKCCGA